MVRINIPSCWLDETGGILLAVNIQLKYIFILLSTLNFIAGGDSLKEKLVQGKKCHSKLIIICTYKYYYQHISPCMVRLSFRSMIFCNTDFPYDDGCFNMIPGGRPSICNPYSFCSKGALLWC